jgi:hypothetical protein
MHVVSGAFGYIGKYIARELMGRGEEVRTIITHPDKPNPFGWSITDEKVPSPRHGESSTLPSPARQRCAIAGVLFFVRSDA